MEIVLDTNVFLSALLGERGERQSASQVCLERCLLRLDPPYFGAALVAEYEEKVEDEALWAESGVTPEQRRIILADLLKSARWVNVWFTWRPNLPDADDDHVYELALAAQVEHLVTQNVRDFRRAELKPFALPRVVTPGEHLRTVRNK